MGLEADVYCCGDTGPASVQVCHGTTQVGVTVLCTVNACDLDAQEAVHLVYCAVDA